MNEKAQNLLYRSFDSGLTAAERQELEYALSESQALRDEKKQILEMRELIKESAEHSFQPFFSVRVLNRLRSEKGFGTDFFASLAWSFRTVAVVAGIIIVLLFAHNSFVRDGVSIDSLLGIPKLQLEDTWQVEIIPAEDI
jgi:hypothetical protein